MEWASVGFVSPTAIVVLAEAYIASFLTGCTCYLQAISHRPWASALLVPFPWACVAQLVATFSSNMPSLKLRKYSRHLLNSGLRQNRDGILHINHPTLKTLSKPSNSVNSLNLTNCSMFFSYFELNLPSLDISPNFGSPCILCVGLLERVSSLCLCVYDCFWPFSIMVLVWLLSRFDTLSHSVGRVLARN